MGKDYLRGNSALKLQRKTVKMASAYRRLRGAGLRCWKRQPGNVLRPMDVKRKTIPAAIPETLRRISYDIH